MPVSFDIASQKLLWHFEGLDELLALFGLLLNLYLLIIFSQYSDQVVLNNLDCLYLAKDDLGLDNFQYQIHNQEVLTRQNQGFHHILLDILSYWNEQNLNVQIFGGQML